MEFFQYMLLVISLRRFELGAFVMYEVIDVKLCPFKSIFIEINQASPKPFPGAFRLVYANLCKVHF